jgi:hypothetical protein
MKLLCFILGLAIGILLPFAIKKIKQMFNHQNYCNHEKK